MLAESPRLTPSLPDAPAEDPAMAVSRMYKAHDFAGDKARLRRQQADRPAKASGKSQERPTATHVHPLIPKACRPARPA